MRFDIYVGQTKYFSTLSGSEAFDMFRKWIGRGLNVQMQFIKL
jgi:hypothetical protein